MFGTLVASKTMEESSILSTPAKGFFMKTVNEEDIRGGIQKNIEICLDNLESIHKQYRFEMDKLIKLNAQLVCKHDFVLKRAGNDFQPYDVYECKHCGLNAFK